MDNQCHAPRLLLSSECFPLQLPAPLPQTYKLPLTSPQPPGQIHIQSILLSKLILFQLLECATISPPQDLGTCFLFFLSLSPTLPSTVPPAKSTLHRNPSSPTLSKQQFYSCGFSLQALIPLRALISFCNYFLCLFTCFDFLPHQNICS